MIVLTIAFGLLVAGGTFVSSTVASQDVEQEVQQAVTGYINAVKTGNVDEAVKYVHDTRFPNVEATKAQYKNLFKESPMSHAEIVSIVEVDDTHAQVTIKAKTKLSGTQEVTLPVVKEDGQWKVLITGQKVDRNVE